MKYLITESQYKKIISEMDEFPHEASLEERQQEIIKRKQLIEKILPKIIKFFEFKYKDDLEKIEVEDSSTTYGHENLTIEHPRIVFYFNNFERGRGGEIIGGGDLRNFFNIDIYQYGVPLDVKLKVKTRKGTY